MCGQIKRSQINKSEDNNHLLIFKGLNYSYVNYFNAERLGLCSDILPIQESLIKAEDFLIPKGQLNCEFDRANNAYDLEYYSLNKASNTLYADRLTATEVISNVELLISIIAKSQNILKVNFSKSQKKKKNLNKQFHTKRKNE